MPDLKIAILGAASHTFGPRVLHDALVHHRLDVELALCDPDEEGLFLMADLARAMAKKSGSRARITTHPDRPGALDGADFVINNAAREFHLRADTDRQIVAQFYPGHLVTEFGGVAGIAYSLRQIALVRLITADMRRLCPAAILINLADPLPRVCQAAHEDGVTTVGLCNHHLLAYKHVWEILHAEKLDHPFDDARAAFDVAMAGLNHLSFITDLWDHETGDDLYPRLRQTVAAADHPAHQPLSEAIFLELGCFPTAGDGRVRDFVEPVGPLEEPPSARVSPEEHRRQRDRIKKIVDRGHPWEPLLADNPCWEKPIDLIAALAFNKPMTFMALNVINDGLFPQLPKNVFVETPATVDRKGIRPVPVALPEKTLPLLQNTAQVTAAIVASTKWNDSTALDEALELDPTVRDIARAKLALDACLKAHADVLVQFAPKPAA